MLLWVHVKEKISKREYEQKIDEINKVCDDIMNRYKDVDIFTTNGNKTRTTLEQLCYAVKSSMEIIKKTEQTKKLEKEIDIILDWLINIDIETKKAEIEGRTYTVLENKYQEKIDEINEYCNTIYNGILNIDTSGIIIDDENDHSIGTSISDLKK